ncbi:hypothetical protein OIE66_24265 [Nonomuraea sp. NBC_01738]|uniref:hypothetical protein n=1 Tax=Nonomuraea sp. NBC_01738 TaxID=2976003 RepID=UPI002E0E982E|nr:hypothetical protein OIE66_24265 [Nonomuraea sp. NBC_01738]
MNIPSRICETDLANEPAGQASGPGARALLAAIMAEEPAPQEHPTGAAGRPGVRRGRRLLIAVTTAVATVGVAAAVAIAVGLPGDGPATSYANAAVSITRADDDYSIAFTQPVRDPRLLEEAFRAVGVQAMIKLVPALPEHVGLLYGPHFDSPGWRGNITMETVEPCPAGSTCATFKMAGGSPDSLVFGLGRAAAPGEPYADLSPVHVGRYQSALDGYRPDGFDPHGKTVAAVRAELDKRGLKAVYQLWWNYPDGHFFSSSAPAGQIADGWIVERSRAYSSDTIEVTVVPGPEAGPAPSPSPRLHWWDVP